MSRPVWPDYTSLLVEQSDRRLWVTFNRPRIRNALTHEMMGEIGDVVARVRNDDSVRTLILRGAERQFSAGGDLNAMRDMPPPVAGGARDPLFDAYRAFGHVLSALDTLPKAVVAVVEGAAAGGGFGMACCADITIVRADAKFGLPETQVGFIPSQILPFIARRIGVDQVRRIAMLGLRISGEEAYRLGVGHYLVHDDAATEQCLADVLAQLDRCDPAAVAAVKDVVLATEFEPRLAVMDRAAHHLVRLLRRPEAMDGMQAFLDKLPPPWAR